MCIKTFSNFHVTKSWFLFFFLVRAGKGKGRSEVVLKTQIEVGGGGEGEKARSNKAKLYLRGSADILRQLGEQRGRQPLIEVAKEVTDSDDVDVGVVLHFRRVPTRGEEEGTTVPVPAAQERGGVVEEEDEEEEEEEEKTAEEKVSAVLLYCRSCGIKDVRRIYQQCEACELSSLLL